MITNGALNFLFALEDEGATVESIGEGVCEGEPFCHFEEFCFFGDVVKGDDFSYYLIIFLFDVGALDFIVIFELVLGEGDFSFFYIGVEEVG